MKSFASDNWSGVHPDILKALGEVNKEHEAAYCEDSVSKRATEIFKDKFGAQAEVFFAFNGTGANVLALNATTRSYNAILCADTAHIYTDECGAPAKQIGCSIIPLPSHNGKITPENIKKHLKGFGEVHHAQPKTISITQSTELGTVYSSAEIKAIADLAHAHNMFLHVDGSRLVNAAATLNESFYTICTETGVDVLSLGGTKNGMMLGECVIFINPACAHDVQYIRKQNAQLFSKMRFVAAQYIAYFENDLWLKNAKAANSMATLLAQKLNKELPNVVIKYPVQSNAVFAQIPIDTIAKAQEKYPFYIWDEQENIVRLMCSFDTNEDDIDGLISCLKEGLDK